MWLRSSKETAAALGKCLLSHHILRWNTQEATILGTDQLIKWFQDVPHALGEAELSPALRGWCAKHGLRGAYRKEAEAELVGGRWSKGFDAIDNTLVHSKICL